VKILVEFLAACKWDETHTPRTKVGVASIQLNALYRIDVADDSASGDEVILRSRDDSDQKS
jgi:hypothetical protein